MNTIRRATQSEALTIQNMMSTIPWIRTEPELRDGVAKIQDMCSRGEIYVSTKGAVIVSLMILTKDRFAASLGINNGEIRLILTIETQQRNGYARGMVRKAKQVVGDGVIKAYVENEKSLALLVSEGFTPVAGVADKSGYPLYQWATTNYARATSR
jgi:hypothetical protein